MGRLIIWAVTLWTMSLVPSPAAGIITGPIIRNDALRARGIDAYPVGAWDGQDWLGTSRQLMLAIKFLIADNAP